MELASARRAQLVDDTWAELSGEMPEAGLERVHAMLDVWAGRRAAEVAPMQRCLFDVFMPGVPSAPWYDVADFPCAAILEEHYAELRTELDAAIADGIRFQPYGRAPDGRPLPVGAIPTGWQEIKLCWRSRPVASVCAVLPRAAAVMAEVLAHSKVLAQFSYLALAPCTRIGEHTDAVNALASCHLGMKIPVGCGLSVAGESRQWAEGRCLAFDNSYVHDAWNDNCSETRIVLAVHGPHPDLTEPERKAMAWLADRVLAG